MSVSVLSVLRYCAAASLWIAQSNHLFVNKGHSWIDKGLFMAKMGSSWPFE